MSIGLVYSGEYRDNGTPYYFRYALASLGIDHKWYWPQYGIPEGHDFYLVIDDGRDDLEHKPPHPCGYYATDTHLGYEVRRRKAEHFDIVWCAQKDAAERFAQDGLNAYWLPLACSPEHHSSGPQPTLYDLAFVGHLQDPSVSGRIDFLDHFVKTFRTRFRFEFGLFHQDMAKAYRRARIGVNHAVREDLNMRTFELASIGVPQLCKQSMVGLSECGFLPWKHYIPYTDKRDAVEEALWCLENPEGLGEMALRAQELVRERHTYTKRVQSMLSDVAGLGGPCVNSEPVSTAVECGRLSV